MQGYGFGRGGWRSSKYQNDLAFSLAVFGAMASWTRDHAEIFCQDDDFRSWVSDSNRLRLRISFSEFGHLPLFGSRIERQSLLRVGTTETGTCGRCA